ncbi:MAG: hypothetical protein AB1630_06535 [bacterium]
MNECEFFGVSEEGNFICKKIPRYNRITKEICKAHCPVYEKRCSHLVFSLRKDEVFSALGVGGRRVEIRIERAVCDKIKEPIFDIKKCQTCPDFTEKGKEKEVVKIEKEEDIVKIGLKALVASLGEEKTREFIEAIKGKKEEPKTKDELAKEIEKWLSLE